MDAETYDLAVKVRAVHAHDIARDLADAVIYAYEATVDDGPRPISCYFCDKPAVTMEAGYAVCAKLLHAVAGEKVWLDVQAVKPKPSDPIPDYPCPSEDHTAEACGYCDDYPAVVPERSTCRHCGGAIEPTTTGGSKPLLAWIHAAEPGTSSRWTYCPRQDWELGIADRKFAEPVAPVVEAPAPVSGHYDADALARAVMGSLELFGRAGRGFYIADDVQRLAASIKAAER
jgi:hypothetical protein